VSATAIRQRDLGVYPAHPFRNTFKEEKD